ncbi:hypothetical protein LguiA_012128 [Lonicera macranthoides]
MNQINEKESRINNNVKDQSGATCETNKTACEEEIVNNEEEEEDDDSSSQFSFFPFTNIETFEDEIIDSEDDDIKFFYSSVTSFTNAKPRGEEIVETWIASSSNSNAANEEEEEEIVETWIASSSNSNAANEEEEISHKDAKGLRNKPFPHYNVLIEIYGKDRANGDGAIDPQEEEDVIRANFHCLDDDEILPNDGLDGIEVSSTQEHRTPSINRGKGTKRPKVTDGFNASLGVMASSFKKFVECTNANLDKLANGLYVNHENELGKKVVDELSNMEGLDEEDVIKAANIIVGDGPKCSLLFALKPSMKVTWVLKLIGKLP